MLKILLTTSLALSLSFGEGKSIDNNNSEKSYFKEDRSFLFQSLKKPGIDIKKTIEIYNTQNIDSTEDLEKIAKEYNLTKEERSYIQLNRFLDLIEKRVEKDTKTVDGHIFLLKIYKKLLLDNNINQSYYLKRVNNYISNIDGNNFYREYSFQKIPEIDLNSNIYLIYYYLYKDGVKRKNPLLMISALNGYLLLFKDLFQEDFKNFKEYLVYKHLRNNFNYLPKEDEIEQLQLTIYKNPIKLTVNNLNMVKTVSKKNGTEELNKLFEDIKINVDLINKYLEEKNHFFN